MQFHSTTSQCDKLSEICSHLQRAEKNPAFVCLLVWNSRKNLQDVSWFRQLSPKTQPQSTGVPMDLIYFFTGFTCTWPGWREPETEKGNRWMRS